MKAIGLLVFFLVSCTNASVLRSDGGFHKTKGEPWPMPQAYTSYPIALTVDQTLQFKSNLATCDVISQAILRYKTYITSAACARAGNNGASRDPENIHDGHIATSRLLSVDIDVQGVCEKYPTPSSDEEYSLIVNTPSSEGKALIQAATIWGALRGLETFSQLVYEGAPGVLLVNSTLILDFPRFNYRGLLLDTSRHFLPVRALLENLEAMAQNKLNVFHWHIVDDQSFPYVSKAFPNLSKLGSFDPEHIYSPADVAKVLEFARVRGIRVIPEFDTPGHTQSWGPGQPNLLTPCYNQGKSDGTFGPVNPILDTTYKFFQAFFQEIKSVFPDQYIHLGGDEVSFDCWKSNPDILNFMKVRSMGQNFSLLEDYYEQNLVNIMTGLQKNFIVWQELFDNQVKMDKKTVIHIWKGGYQDELSAVTMAGYNTILSTPWYMDYISYGSDWQKYYNSEPYNFNGTDAQKALVVGGSACLWGEFVDGNNVMGYAWPRVSSVAERLWSDMTITDATAAAPRLEEQRCRMMKRGLTVQPVNGPSYCKCDIYN